MNKTFHPVEARGGSNKAVTTVLKKLITICTNAWHAALRAEEI
jgi:hypothetical protein